MSFENLLYQNSVISALYWHISYQFIKICL